MLSRCFNLKLLVACVTACMFAESTNIATAADANNDFTEYFKPVTKKTNCYGVAYVAQYVV